MLQYLQFSSKKGSDAKRANITEKISSLLLQTTELHLLTIHPFSSQLPWGEWQATPCKGHPPVTELT